MIILFRIIWKGFILSFYAIFVGLGILGLSALTWNIKYLEIGVDLMDEVLKLTLFKEN